MHVAILTFEGFNELDSFIAFGILNRVPGWRVSIASPTDKVRSMNGLTVEAQVSLEEAGVAVLNQPFVANGNVATAGGCLASQYLAAWFIARLAGVDAACDALRYVVPVGEQELYITRALANISPFL
ncbi:hypothetical protein [Pseudomonas sp. HMWF006]|uniref:hypothetical protein n=1 Tax=Pseudomonas sp. HMWF006 TaxID=2056843 RepID=UPI000D4EB895|nr:hypothetical protein [Pseudomonas sp. HMWF006]PTT02618.1 hypothetical protein DBR24_06675 [Pseudomonas sp. HMWF006]PTT72572.1 hypothetical protein DBR26_04940 [Pseudomonas sp. HMWF007]PTT92477.1 hypothetical protein DBR29_09060 [Pseudomonas sp. HMWF005]